MTVRKVVRKDKRLPIKNWRSEKSASTSRFQEGGPRAEEEEEVKSPKKVTGHPKVWIRRRRSKRRRREERNEES